MSRAYCTLIFFILCASATTCKGSCLHGSVRLVNGPDSNAGRLELCLYTVWGTVAGWYFDTQEATVVCRMLGYNVDPSSGSSSYLPSAAYGQGSGPVWILIPGCVGSEESLLDCQTSSTDSTTSHSSDVSVVCQKHVCTDGSVRLVGGLVDTEGTVEVCQSGAWNSVCYSNWGYQETFVVCHQLGLPATEIQWSINARFGEGHGTPTLYDWRCFGNESTLGDCLHTTGGMCYHYQEVGVSCNGQEVEVSCIDGGMRLMGPSGHNMVEGRVEYCSNGLWGTLTYYFFDSRDGEVVCRRLGYQHPRVQFYTTPYYGPGSGPIVFSHLSCDGTESKLEDCSVDYVPYYYSHSIDVGLHCFEKELISCTNNDVRLVNGSSPDEGRVEMCVQGEWGTINDGSWDRREAQLACKQLGYQPGYALNYRDSYFGDGNLSVLVDSISCSSSDTMLSQCLLATEWSSAFYGNTAGAKCFAQSGCTQGEIRLVGGKNEREGDVQICWQGVWGYVCGYYWNYDNANVVCQQLNYSSSWYSYSQYSFFIGGQQNLNASIVIDAFTCSGIENKLSDCTLYQYATVNAYCDVGGGVRCEVDVNCTEGSVQLVDGDHSHEGRVELCSSGVWTTIQETTWDYNDARVACRQLGYYDPWSVAIIGLYDTSSQGRLYYSNTYCTGNEQQLTDCSVYTYSLSSSLDYWDNYKRAGVACETNSSADQCFEGGSVRLVGGANEREGRVEVCMGGYWGTVCSDGWTEEDALVVCRQAGHDTLRPVPLTNASFGRGSGPVHMTFVNCIGHEEMLSDCTYSNGIGALNCHHARDAGVVCTSGVPQHYSVEVSTSPSEGPFPIGSVFHLHCHVSPDAPHGTTYQWTSSVSGVSITHQNSTHPNATITILAGHTKYGYYYCRAQSDGSTLATGFTVVQVKSLLFSSQLRLNGSTGKSVTFSLSKTVTTISRYLYQLNWYTDMTKTGFGVPIQADDIKYSLSADNMSLTIMSITRNDAGIYTARYDGLILYPHNKTCEQQLLQALRHYPVLQPVTFTLSVDGSDSNYFGDTYSYFINNSFSTSFQRNEPITINTSAAHLPTDAIKMVWMKEGKEAFLKDTESLFLSEGFSYSGLHLNEPIALLHSGNYETQLHVTSLFSGYECNSVYSSFLSSSIYLGIPDGTVILQSTMQRLTHYESPEVQLTSSLKIFDSTEEATLQCTAVGGYPPVYNMSLVKNDIVILSRVSNEVMYTTMGGLPKDVYGLYACVVNNTAETSSRTILLQQKAPFVLLIQFDTCDPEVDNVEAFEVAILSVIQTYCKCPVDKTKFYNSTTSCSRGEMTFSSTLAHASDDGSVTATTLVQTFEAAIAKEDNPTITVGGQDLAVSMPEDGDDNSVVDAIGMFFAGVSATVLVGSAIIFIICIVGKVFKKKRSSREPETRDDYTDMKYAVKTESLKYERRPQSKPTSPSHQHYVKPSKAAINPVQDIELKENEEGVEDTYESV